MRGEVFKTPRQRRSLDEGTLNTGDGGERPARATLALVLDGGDLTLGAPVLLCRGSGTSDVLGVHLAGQVEGAEVHGLVLSIGLKQSILMRIYT